MAAKTLTREQGYALTDSKKAVRVSVNNLVTRTAMYVWDEQGEYWVCEQQGLKVVHCKGGPGQGFVWSTTVKQFHRCTCEHCTRESPHRTTEEKDHE